MPTPRALLSLFAPVALLAVVAWALALALPQRVVVRPVGGSDDSVWVAAVCTAVWIVWGWWTARDRWAERGDVVAGVLVFVAFCMFQANQLAFLFALVPALGWFAGRTWRLATGRDEQRRVARVPEPPEIAFAAVLVLAHAWLFFQLLAVDVGLSSVLGAEALLDGANPYTDREVLANQGQTYGPLAYLLYVPAAAIFDVEWAEKAMAIAGHLAMLGAGVFLARRLGRCPGAALIALLAFPALTYTLSVSAHDDWLATAVLLAFAAVSPLGAGAALGAAAAIKLYPLVLLPLLVVRWSEAREQLRVMIGFVGVAALTVLPMLVLAGPSVLDSLLTAARGQSSRVGVALWNVPAHEWWPDPFGLPFNFAFLFDPQLPVVQTLAKLLAVGAALYLAARVRAREPGVRQAAAAFAAASATLLLMLASNNLSWNYVSWWAPLVAILLLTRIKQPRRAADEPPDAHVA